MTRRGLTPDRVVDAAIAIADQDGLEAVTIARLAADLGVRPPSLYNHVKSLEYLVRAITLRAANEAARRLGDAAVGRSGADAVTAVAHAYRAFAREYPGRYRALIRAPTPDDAEMVEVGERLVGVMTAALRGFDLEGDDAIHGVRAMRATLHGFVDLENGGGFEMALDVDVSFDRLVASLIAGLEQL